MFHFNHAHKFVCEHETGFQSRAMGQVLLSPIGGGLYGKSETRGEGGMFWVYLFGLLVRLLVCEVLCIIVCNSRVGIMGARCL